MKPNFTPKTLKIIPVQYIDGTIQLSICDEHDEQICLIEIGKENYAPILATALEMYDEIETTIEVIQFIFYTFSLNESERKRLNERIETGKTILKKARGEK